MRKAKAISRDDILNLKIALGLGGDVLDFLKRV